MLRFLEKHRKSSKKSVPPENPAHQTTDIGAEYGRAPKVNIVREIPQLIRPAGLILLRNQITTAEEIHRLQIKMEGLRINSFPRRVPQL